MTESRFEQDYREYLGSLITPSGKVRETPASPKDAMRYAIDEYRKRKRFVDLAVDGENKYYEGNDNVSEVTQISNGTTGESSYVINELVTVIIDSLEAGPKKNLELCRYFVALIVGLNIVNSLSEEVYNKIAKYIATLNMINDMSNDKELGISLNYEISEGSQCYKLRSVRKRLCDHLLKMNINLDNLR